MTTLRRIIHQPDPVRREKIHRMTHVLRMCALATLIGLLLWAVCGCAGPEVGGQTTEVGRKRAANVAKVEKKAWNIGGFLLDLVGKVVVNSATNYVDEKFGIEQGRPLPGASAPALRAAHSAGGLAPLGSLASDRGFRK
jgi:hypothetical protein